MKKRDFSPFSITVHGQLIEYKKPVVMGILNVTPDSFYDGGRHSDPEGMLAHARWLLDEGADIIDVGAVSTRPGALLLPPDEEARRLSEAVRLLRTELPDAVISVDTCYPPRPRRHRGRRRHSKRHRRRPFGQGDVSYYQRLASTLHFDA